MIVRQTDEPMRDLFILGVGLWLAPKASLANPEHLRSQPNRYSALPDRTFGHLASPRSPHQPFAGASTTISASGSGPPRRKSVAVAGSLPRAPSAWTSSRCPCRRTCRATYRSSRCYCQPQTYIGHRIPRFHVLERIHDLAVCEPWRPPMTSSFP